MKIAFVLLLLGLASCVSRPTNDFATWKRVENLSGEALVAALVRSGDAELAEVNEARRNLRLEIAALEAEAKTDDGKQRQYGLKKAMYEHLSAKLHELATQRKMALWQTTQTR